VCLDPICCIKLCFEIVGKIFSLSPYYLRIIKVKLFRSSLSFFKTSDSGLEPETWQKLIRILTLIGLKDITEECSESVWCLLDSVENINSVLSWCRHEREFLVSFDRDLSNLLRVTLISNFLINKRPIREKISSGYLTVFTLV